MAAWLVTRRLSTPGSVGLTLALFLSYAPVTLSFLQGQDAILLLLAFTLSAIAMREGRLLSAGCLLALGLFKFQFALAAALILLGRGRTKFALGLSGVALALLLISAGFGRVVMVAASLIVVGVAMAGWRRTSGHAGVWALALSNTVLAAVLVSYQASPHDLTLLLLPIFLTFAYVKNSQQTPNRWKFVTFVLLGILFLPLVYAYALRLHLYVLIAVPITVLFGSNYAEIVRVGARPSSVSVNRSLQTSVSKLTN